jgi:hypothetical protein
MIRHADLIDPRSIGDAGRLHDRTQVTVEESRYVEKDDRDSDPHILPLRIVAAAVWLTMAPPGSARAAGGRT